MAKIPRTYIQQTKFDGTSYKKGLIVDTMDYNIGCISFPFKMFPETKDLAERDWHDEHGKDVFVPTNGLYLKDYDLEAEFCYKGTMDNIVSDVSTFLKFLRGLNDGAVGGRLTVFDEHIGFGRKDVVAEDVDPDTFKADESDPDALFDFKVKFHVYDPKTEVSLRYDDTELLTDLYFEV